MTERRALTEVPLQLSDCEHGCVMWLPSLGQLVTMITTTFCAQENALHVFSRLCITENIKQKLVQEPEYEALERKRFEVRDAPLKHLPTELPVGHLG